ncbi:GNAT family acetyltransferase [Zooshikella ganghwensis]|uniref:GNAT family acetyltransferase n=1 Tax=Zooshikella ganghwensis TaxID=202772 RepID=UPI00042A7CCF|nr:GNAT family acetyltransferase [Zooshikella ganghwensis]
MQFKVAEIEDIESTLALHYKYQIDSIEEQDKESGFVTTAFTKEQLKHLIEKEQGLFIAKDDNKVVAYVMAASWQFWSAWPMFAHMIKDLPNLTYRGQTLSIDNSYQYGPICIDKHLRGRGTLEAIFDFAKQEMSKRYPILVTFINKVNSRSFEAHTRKLGLDVIQEFTYNNNHYYELACLTQEKC